MIKQLAFISQRDHSLQVYMAEYMQSHHSKHDTTNQCCFNATLPNVKKTLVYCVCLLGLHLKDTIIHNII